MGNSIHKKAEQVPQYHIQHANKPTGVLLLVLFASFFKDIINRDLNLLLDICPELNITQSLVDVDKDATDCQTLFTTNKLEENLNLLNFLLSLVSPNPKPLPTQIEKREDFFKKSEQEQAEYLSAWDEYYHWEYCRILIFDLALPALYYIIIATSENEIIPKTISYYQDCGTGNSPIVIPYEDGSYDHIAFVDYKDMSGGTFTTWFNLKYFSNGKPLRGLTLLSKRVLFVKKPFLLINLRFFKRAMRAFFEKLKAHKIQSTMSMYWLQNAREILQQIPDYWTLDLNYVEKIKFLPGWITSHEYTISKLENKVIAATKKARKKQSFRTICSTPLVSLFLCKEMKRHQIPSRLSFILRNRYICKKTKKELNFSFNEAIHCFVFASCSRAFKQKFPALTNYLQDFAKARSLIEQDQDKQTALYEFQFLELKK